MESNNIITKELKKQYGVFYTPPSISSILCDWAINSPLDTILEPSFGGCGFLEASQKRLLILGSQTPNRQLYGCDIDKNAFQHLAKKIGPVEISGHFILSDFLKLSSVHFATNEFDIIIGNPPYVSKHNMSEEQRETASKAMENDGYIVGTKASLWAYFIMHSMKFLIKDGRMAWVLPSSFLFTDYAIDIRTAISNLFGRVLTVSLGERIFESEGTDEHTVLLLCEGYKMGPASNGIELAYADDTNSMKICIKNWENGESLPNIFNTKYGVAMMAPAASKSYYAISDSLSVIKFGDITNIRIGIVTGDNKYFVINEEYIKKYSLTNKSLRFILAKFNMTSGLALTIDDLAKVRQENSRCMFLDTSRMRKTSRSLLAYLAMYPEAKKLANKTFQKRALWHRPKYGAIPDAFFPYMHQFGPKLVLNEAKITSTNTIHCVYFKAIPKYKKKLAAISMLTTFSQISAEIEGRSYGSGVLKHEPSEAKRILLMMPTDLGVKKVNETYKKIDHLIRGNKLEHARSLADQFIFEKPIKQYGKKILDVLNFTLDDLRSKRRKTRIK